MKRKIAVALLLGCLFLSGCESMRADREWRMELPEKEETDERALVSGIEEYNFSMDVKSSFFLTFLLSVDSLDMDSDRALLWTQVLCGHYGLLNCGLDGGETWLSFIREDGSLLERTVDLRYGFFEDRMEEESLPEMPCGIWTSPNGRRRIRETFTESKYGMVLEQVGEAPRELPLPEGLKKEWGDPVQCRWAADGQHAFLRILPLTDDVMEWQSEVYWVLAGDSSKYWNTRIAVAPSGKNWDKNEEPPEEEPVDSPDQWNEEGADFLIAESGTLGEDVCGVYMLDCTKDEPAWERIMEDPVSSFSHMLPAEDGSRLIFVAGEGYDAGEIGCLSVSADTGWQGRKLLFFPELPGCGLREAALQENMLTAVTSENQLLQLQVDGDQGAVLLDGDRSFVGTFLPAEGAEPACLMLDADLMQLRSDGSVRTIYKGKRGEIALKLARDPDSGSILILYLDSVVHRADGESCRLECRLVRLGFS